MFQLSHGGRQAPASRFGFRASESSSKLSQQGQQLVPEPLPGLVFHESSCLLLLLALYRNHVRGNHNLLIMYLSSRPYVDQVPRHTQDLPFPFPFPFSFPFLTFGRLCAMCANLRYTCCRSSKKPILALQATTGEAVLCARLEGVLYTLPTFVVLSPWYKLRVL